MRRRTALPLIALIGHLAASEPQKEPPAEKAGPQVEAQAAPAGAEPGLPPHPSMEAPRLLAASLPRHDPVHRLPRMRLPLPGESLIEFQSRLALEPFRPDAPVKRVEEKTLAVTPLRLGDRPGESKEILLRTATPLRSFDDLWFEVRYAGPLDLQGTADIDLATYSLEVVPDTRLLAAPYREGVFEVILMARSKAAEYTGSDERFEVISEGLLAKAGQAIRFERLGKGAYKVRLLLPGAAMWESPPVELNRGSVEMGALLRPGADLRFRILAPSRNGRRDRDVRFRLASEYGRQYTVAEHAYDFETNTFRGLPLGRYLLRIYSSREKLQRLKLSNPDGYASLLEPGAPEYQGRTIAFELTSTRPVVNLGIIRLAPAKPK